MSSGDFFVDIFIKNMIIFVIFRKFVKNPFMDATITANKKYSYADYLQWLDDKRRELFNGIAKLMSPAPSSEHQAVSGEIFVALKTRLKKKKCKIFYAPFDVRLPENNKTDDKEIFTVVQPDISIICDETKIDSKGCLGAPDMIIEIVSEKNSKRDVEDKFLIYQKHGVREYWLVFPHEKTVQCFVLKNNKYQLAGMFAEKGKVKVNIFDDIYINLEDIFEE